MMHAQSCCFAKSKPTAFLLFLLLLMSSLLKLPTKLQEGKGEEKIGWKKPHGKNNAAQRKLYTPLDHMKDVANYLAYIGNWLQIHQQ